MSIEYVIRAGELTLKGANRSSFEGRLTKNIRRLLRGISCDVRWRSGRCYLSINDMHAPAAENALSKLFGIVGYSPTQKVEKQIKAITDAAIEAVSATDASRLSRTYKVRSKRSDKSFEYNSHQIETIVGAALGKAYPLLEVNLSDPDILVQIEIREKAYVFVHTSSGLSGLPVGCAGRGILLLSGGIDSPVAAYFMAKRGMKLDALYFHTYPYTSNDALDKVEQLATILSPFNIGITTFVVDFTSIATHIRKCGRPTFTTILMRGAMMEIATLLASERHALGLITGESLSQVASQTVESLRFVDSKAGFPVFRPLIGFDKLETIAWAKRIRTYPISILPYDDCCTVFTPDNPVTRPSLESVTREYEHLEMDKLIAEAFASKTARWFEPKLS